VYPWLNPLNAELNSICHLLALLGAHHILHVRRIRVNISLRSGRISSCKGCTPWLIYSSRDIIPYAASWVALSAALSSSYNEYCFTMINYRINSLVLRVCFPRKINDVNVVVVVVKIIPFQSFYAVTAQHY
jgi:hypothetical protein